MVGGVLADKWGRPKAVIVTNVISGTSFPLPPPSFDLHLHIHLFFHLHLHFFASVLRFYSRQLIVDSLGICSFIIGFFNFSPIGAGIVLMVRFTFSSLPLFPLPSIFSSLSSSILTVDLGILGPSRFGAIQVPSCSSFSSALSLPPSSLFPHPYVLLASPLFLQPPYSYPLPPPPSSFSPLLTSPSLPSLVR